MEIHHIIPQEENGPDTEDNAAPLCPTCHETYGANPTKRKFIREARDFWYEICDKRYASVPPDFMAEIRDCFQMSASQSDIINLKNEVLTEIRSNKNYLITHHSYPALSNLGIEQILARIFAQESQRDESHFDFIFDENCWFDEELIEIRGEFLRLFGERTAIRLCINILDELGLDLKEGFTEEEFEKLLNSIHVEAILLILCAEGKIKATVDERGQLTWYPTNVTQLDI